MKVLAKNLPSQGYLTKGNIIDIEPLNYGQLIKYSEVKFNKGQEVSEFLWDFDNLVKTIVGWEDLCSFDLPAIIALRKMVSINLQGTFTLSSGKEFSLKDVNFTDFNENLSQLEGVTLDIFRKASLKPLTVFYKDLCVFQGSKVESLKLAVLGSYLGMSPEQMTNLTTDNIALCERLFPSLMTQPKILIEGGAEVVLYGKASELFQNVIGLSKPDETKIRLQKKV